MDQLRCDGNWHGVAELAAKTPSSPSVQLAAVEARVNLAEHTAQAVAQLLPQIPADLGPVDQFVAACLEGHVEVLCGNWRGALKKLEATAKPPTPLSGYLGACLIKSRALLTQANAELGNTVEAIEWGQSLDITERTLETNREAAVWAARLYSALYACEPSESCRKLYEKAVKVGKLGGDDRVPQLDSTVTRGGQAAPAATAGSSGTPASSSGTPYAEGPNGTVNGTPTSRGLPPVKSSGSAAAPTAAAAVNGTHAQSTQSPPQSAPHSARPVASHKATPLQNSRDAQARKEAECESQAAVWRASVTFQQPLHLVVFSQDRQATKSLRANLEIALKDTFTSPVVMRLFVGVLVALGEYDEATAAFRTYIAYQKLQLLKQKSGAHAKPDDIAECAGLFSLMLSLLVELPQRDKPGAIKQLVQDVRDLMGEHTHEADNLTAHGHVEATEGSEQQAQVKEAEEQGNRFEKHHVDEKYFDPDANCTPSGTPGSSSTPGSTGASSQPSPFHAVLARAYEWQARNAVGNVYFDDRYEHAAHHFSLCEWDADAATAHAWALHRLVTAGPSQVFPLVKAATVKFPDYLPLWHVLIVLLTADQQYALAEQIASGVLASDSLDFALLGDVAKLYLLEIKKTLVAIVEVQHGISAALEQLHSTLELVNQMYETELSTELSSSHTKSTSKKTKKSRHHHPHLPGHLPGLRKKGTLDRVNDRANARANSQNYRIGASADVAPPAAPSHFIVDVWLWAAQMYTRASLLEEATAAIKEAEEYGVTASTLAATAHIKALSDPKAAWAVYSDALALEYDNMSAVIGRSNLLEVQPLFSNPSEHLEATRSNMSALENLVNHCPGRDTPEAWYLYGATLESTGDISGAKKAYWKSVALEERNGVRAYVPYFEYSRT